MLLATAVPAQADDTQIVTIGGQKIEKPVSRLTFDGDKVVLHFTDDTTQEADMEDVTIAFSIVNAMTSLKAEASDAPLAYFDMNGRQLKKAPKKGPFIIQKGKKVVKIMKQD